MAARTRSRMTTRMARLPLCLLFVLLLAAASVPASASAQTAAFPDLHTLPPRDLRFDRTDVSVDGSGVMRNVLRFSNACVHSGISWEHTTGACTTASTSSSISTRSPLRPVPNTRS